MEEKKSLINKIKELFSGMRLIQKMLTVYLVGFVLPIAVVFVYMYLGNRKALVQQELDNEYSKLEVLSESIDSSMVLAEELSNKFQFDSETHKFEFSKYQDDEKEDIDYRNFSIVSDYVAEEYKNVSRVTFYSQDEETPIDNNHFKMITPTIRQKNWFVSTLYGSGKPCWSYQTDVQTGKKSIRMTRTIYTDDKKFAGVVSVSIDEDICNSILDSEKSDLLLVYNNDEIIQTNTNLSQSDVADLMSVVGAPSFDGWMNIDGERYVISRFKIEPRYGDDFYYIVSMKSYYEVVALANRSAVSALIPLVIALVIASLAVLTLSTWLTRRINSFSSVMHEAAKGNFHVDNPNLGSSRDEIWELNNDLNQMIDDIEKLMEVAIAERVQKEQLYSRQKDVEFKMLATQINPHFLYNTLENIRMLARINKQPEIEDISVALTKLMRGNLNVGQDLKTLKWEMDMVQYYISIQNYRFSDRIRAEVTYDKELAEKYMIIPLVVQPFVENAYVHAMEDKESDGLITVRVEITDKLELYIEDNGHGMSTEMLKEITRYINDFDNIDRTHIGICNVNQRIKLKFGDEFGVDFESIENVGTKVKILMPLIPAN